MLGVKKSHHSIIIEGLPSECVETDLIQLLLPCGKVCAVSLHRPSTATVEFQAREQAEAAIYLLENSLVWGRRLRYTELSVLSYCLL